MNIERRQTVKYAEDIEFKEMLLSEKSPFALKEAYKALRTNINFCLPKKGCRVIGFTSSNRHEGKSSNAVNTAIAFSQIGKKVLLVDCDMRLPTVASKLRVKGRPGLSDYLIGEATLEDSIHKTSYADVDVFVSGSIPPDPTGLLESEAMDELFKTLRTRYDYIVVDLPPVTTVTDAAIIAPHIDGFLLVVRHNQSVLKAITEMKRLLQMVNAKVLGVLYNDAPISDKGSYHYYGYGD